MTVLEQLVATDAPAVRDLIVTYVSPSADTVQTTWDNQPTWDNWKKTPAPFDNRPTWDNWKKRS